MIIFFIFLIFAGVIMILVSLIAIGSEWSSPGWLDETADIMAERMELDRRMINGENVTEERAALEAKVEPHPGHNPNSGVWRWKNG